ncbi:MAG: MG2 domain-containing protein [Candidatus Pedobacter colombiensis]|uniref:MG2 domain-containing protein n=1 Tax=Candidatus Pedobacter colombiensis TaxID=3121371 RepID=A0AAJ5W9X9_9SPHI|nr:MG2 domain-containing protein [Pedobacter sp.]WEK21503.1 MAG: MG2 domain-containing protein [Pedobacter sp.]
MKTTSPSFFQKNKGGFVIGLVTLVLIGIGAFFFFKKSKPKDYNQQYAKYIEAYTSGTVSKKSFIRVHLANQVKTMSDIGVADSRDLFSFSPAVKGKSYWIDAQTVEFRPEESLKPGETYEATFNLNKVTDTEEGLESFEFDFRVIKPGMFLTQNGLVSQNNTSLDYMKLSGEISTSDQEDTKLIEKALKVDFPQSLKVKWQHNPAKNTSTFTVDSIKKTKQENKLKLLWSGEPIAADSKGEETVTVPAIGVFKILNIRAVQELEDYALVQFSEPISVGQDLNGLVSLAGLTDLRFTIDASQIKIYSPNTLEGNYSLTVNEGVENINGKKLQAAKTANIVFENKLPSVVIAGSGTIIPNSGKLVLPFEAVNLKAVDVTIIKIYENNIPQFFQTNNYKDGGELRRVGKPVIQKTIRLDEDKALDLHKKHRYTLDLDKIIRTEPGAMYRVTIGFRRAYNVYKCAEAEAAVGDSENEYERYGEKIDEDDEFWERYNSYYPNNYRWEDRDNPCTPSYYTNERWASRNLIASNIGLIAKRGNDNSMLIIATDLLTAKTLSGITLELLDYQRQVIHTVTTDADGMASFDLKRKPFLLVAKNGKERGYLKLDDGNSLPLSRFDVGGDVVQNGLKGFIYGERGVWRPGDSVFLSFVLEDKLKKLPGAYPITFEFYNPQGQLIKRSINGKPLNGFYAFKTATESTSPTGNWLAKVKAGGATFTKTIKIETVMPNRLKINFDIGNRTYLGSGGPSTATLSATWLFGAVGKNLKAKVDVNLNTMKTTFKGFDNFTFDNPTIVFQSQVKTIFEGTLSENGTATINTNLNENNSAPGMLKANFTTKVFEAGGNFSIDNFSIPYHVYSNYYGIKTPEGEKMSGMLFTGQDHKVDIVNVDRDGKLLQGNKNVEVELYKVQWRWWWEQDNENSFANFTQNSYNKLIKKENVTLSNGKGNWKFRIDEPEWGRYLILVRDLNGGHVTGKSVYIDWPGWAQREQSSNPTEASMLSFTANKTKFQVGEEVVLTIPSGDGGRALISIENGSKVLKTFWTDTKKGQTQFKFKAEKEMAPNVFANVTLLQPHAQTVNDLPIRMYGAIPLMVEDPQTILKPVIKMADKLKPETESTITVSEQNGKAMTYTVALVDEGLLDLTRFKTPDAHAVFYAREGLGVKTWDLFDYVLGAWGGNLERILSIGGDGSINRNLNPAKANRFVPVVKYLGPFALAKGASQTHKFKLPQYIGAVRAMVIAGQDGAYGSVEKSVQVKKPLMLLATVPRVIGPGESFTLPATVFATENNLKNVTVQLQLQNLQVQGNKTVQLTFKQPGEQMAYFEVKAPEMTGIAKIKLIAQSGAEKTAYDVELDIRNPNPFVTNVTSAVLEQGRQWATKYLPVGMVGTNSGSVEVSSIPPINLKKRLSYLVQYPHGCVEQTTSGIFPQLFLNKLTPLTEQQKAETERNLKAGINKLRGFQTTDGGLGYWPGASSSDEWGSNYAGHFLVEAQNAGYTTPVGMLDELLRYLKVKAANWSPNSNNFYGGDLSQSYRLYVLALAKRADMAAMNRLRAFQYLSVSAKWRLAAAYKLAGQTDAASNLIKDLSTEVKPYNQLGGTYGSDIRDEAMILETLTLLGRKAEGAKMVQSLAIKLGKDDWYSTQTTAYSLLAIAKFCGANTASNNLQYSYSIDGKSGKVNSNQFLNSTALTFTGGNNVTVNNNGKNVLFIRLILQGQPAAGQNNFLPNNPEVLDMSVSYKLLNGKPLDPAVLKQGTDFYAEVVVKNPGKMGYYEQMALTQIFPSGWEIINTRVNDNESILAASPYTYRDIRDDRVFTYFNLRESETVTYKVLLNASYIGRYYLSAVQCEAMYNNSISATEAGKWVQVIK